jgi:hypothetical protein
MMPLWLQTIFVLLILATAIAFVARQFCSALAGRRSKIGSCCAKGCGDATSPTPKPQTAFIPSELLIRRK